MRTLCQPIHIAAAVAALAWTIPVYAQTAVTTIESERAIDGYIGVKDTWLKPDTRDTHCGNQQNRVIGYWDSRALLRFDVSNIPRGATITSATLKLYCHYAQDPRDSRSISAYAVLRDWKEMEATHDQYAKSNKW